MRAVIDEDGYQKWLCFNSLSQDDGCPPPPAACTIAASWLPAERAAARLQAAVNAAYVRDWYQDGKRVG